MKRQHFALLLLALWLSLSFGAGLAEQDGQILAEKVSPSALSSGDRIVIVNESDELALSRQALTDARLSGERITYQETALRRVLTSLPQNAAVFDLTQTEGGWLLGSAEGYLTASENGSALFYSPEPLPGSVWQFVGEGFLYNPAAVSVNGTNVYQNYYLQVYKGYVTVYGKRSSSKESSFAMGFYRLGNSMPEDALLKENYYYLPVFGTSDVHGYLANVNASGETEYLMAYISGRVNDARSEGKDRAVLLDGGDIYQGTTLSNLTSGNAMSAAYALMEYDAVALGNHEFDWSLENTVDADGTAMDYDLGENWQGINGIPVLVSNLYQNGNKVPWGRDHIILEKTAADADGNVLPVRIGVIGMAGDYGGSIMPDRFTGQGYSVRLDYAGINALAEQLEGSGACDATILLAHESAEKAANGLGQGTAIDLVLGGHTHLNVCARTTWGLRYMEPSYNAKAYARVDLAFASDADGPRFVRPVNAEVIPVPALANTEENAALLDQRIAALTDDALDTISGMLNTRVGTITESVLRRVYLPGSGGRATSCGSWMCSILARITGADMAFVNSGGIRAEFEVDSQTGERGITRSDVFTLFPFGNSIYLFELSYADLKTALEYALNKNGKSLLSEVSGIFCYYEGTEVEAILAPDGQAVYIEGDWQDGWQDRKVTVAVSDYIVSTDRNDAGMSNPFCTWKDTDRLIDYGKTDNLSAIDVLEAEAAANGGYLYIDTRPHMILGDMEP